MRGYRGFFVAFVILTVIPLINCESAVSKNYEEITPMLDVLTKKAQSAFEHGEFENGEQAVFDYIDAKNPNILRWFSENDYELEVGVVGDYAVVVVCDDGRPIFEDTYCNSGYPDKDHRSNQNLRACEITMTVEEVKGFCE